MSRLLVPNSTQIPDIIFDQWMAELSGAEFKVLMYIARRTYGFGKERDSISLTQIAEGIKRRDGTVLDRGTGASRSSVARSLKVLEDLGIINKQRHLSEKGNEHEENTYSINLDWRPAGPAGQGPGGGAGPGGWSQNETTPSQNDTGVVSKSDHGWSQPETRVVSKWDLQETDIQHPEQETAAAGAGAPAAGGAADAAFSSLVRELVSHGVGRATAEELAREKPDACRRYLGYLPFAKVKKSKGAWLANAIRDEYGPPEGMANQPLTPPPAPGTHSRKPRQGLKEAQGRANLVRLRAAYASMEKAQPEAYMAFIRYLDSERARAERMASALSPERRASYLAAFDDEERRLELFERWLSVSGLSFSTLRSSAVALATGS